MRKINQAEQRLTPADPFPQCGYTFGNDALERRAHLASLNINLGDPERRTGHLQFTLTSAQDFFGNMLAFIQFRCSLQLVFRQGIFCCR